jgi:hypothetical protein
VINESATERPSGVKHNKINNTFMNDQPIMNFQISPNNHLLNNFEYTFSPLYQNDAELEPQEGMR